MYSVRVSINYRALGVLDEGDIVWFWIGPHHEYDQLLRSRLKTPCRAVFRVVKRSRRRAFFIGRDALDPSGLESKQRSKP